MTNETPSVVEAMKQLYSSAGEFHLRPKGLFTVRPCNLAAARKAVLKLPAIDFRLARYNQQTVLHVVVSLATNTVQEARAWTGRAAADSARRELAREQRAFFRDLVAFILEQGAAVDQRDDWGETALYQAAPGDPAIVKLLLQHGADPNLAKSGGSTPLMAACTHLGASYGTHFRVSAETVELLLAAGANPEAHLANGRTALQMLDRKYKDVATLLSAAGANTASPKPKPHHKLKPAHLARQGNLEALLALADEEGDAMAYKWLCVAVDFGHAKAAKMANDLLETSTLRVDDEGLAQGHAHWELAVAYLRGEEGLATDLRRGSEHLAFAMKLLAARFESICQPRALIRHLSAEAQEVVERALSAPGAKAKEKKKAATGRKARPGSR